MSNDSLTWMQRLQEYSKLMEYGWLLIISVWAGTARYVNSLNGKKPTMFGWLAETIVSGFVGVISAMICQYYQLDFMLIAAITGISAHNGTRSLYLFRNLLKNSIK